MHSTAQHSTAQHSTAHLRQAFWFSFVFIILLGLSGCGGGGSGGGGSTGGAAPAAPVGFLVTNIYSTQIDLSWTAVAGATGYNVYGSSIASLTVSPANKKNITPVVAGTTSSVTGLTPSTQYYFLVTALNATGESVGSSVVMAKTSPPVPPPAAPTSLIATAMNDVQINLIWNFVPDVTGYNVYRSTTANVALSAGNKITATPVTATSYIDTAGLAALTPYFYKITAVNSTGESLLGSNEATTTTSAVGGFSGTAAQYLTKTAVGNTWTMATTSSTVAMTGSASGNSNSVGNSVRMVSASAGGVVSSTITSTSTETLNGVVKAPVTSTNLISQQLNATGLVTNYLSGGSELTLPSTFTVGTFWTVSPAGSVSGTPVSAIIGVIDAFNVTRTVPAGTFSDCLQFTYTGDTATTHLGVTYYYSPSVGTVIETTTHWNYSIPGVLARGDAATQLQAGYIANP